MTSMDMPAIWAAFMNSQIGVGTILIDRPLGFVSSKLKKFAVTSVTLQ